MARVGYRPEIVTTQASEPEGDFLRCKCGKIVSQINRTQVIIKCRHCKRYVIIYTKGVEKIEYR